MWKTFLFINHKEKNKENISLALHETKIEIVTNIRFIKRFCTMTLFTWMYSTVCRPYTVLIVTVCFVCSNEHMKYWESLLFIENWMQLHIPKFLQISQMPFSLLNAHLGKSAKESRAGIDLGIQRAQPESWTSLCKRDGILLQTVMKNTP